MAGEGMAAAGGLLAAIGADKSAKASEKVAKQTLQLNRDQLAQNKQIQEEQVAALTPWREAGRRALDDIYNGIQSGAFDPGRFGFDVKQMEKDPGYQFRAKEGNRLMNQRVGATGKYFSTQGQKQLQDYSQNLASQEYGNAYNRAKAEWGMDDDRLSTKYNMLNNLNSSGQNAVTGINAAGNNLISNNQNANTMIENSYNDIGAAKASKWNALADIGMMGVGAGAKKMATS